MEERKKLPCCYRWDRTGGQPASTHNNQEFVKGFNQAEIFSHQLITNCDKVSALGCGCFCLAGGNEGIR